MMHKCKVSLNESSAESSCCTRRNKAQKGYIETNSLKLKITSVRWPPSTHEIKKIIKISDLNQRNPI